MVTKASRPKTRKGLEKWPEEEWQTKEGDERAREGDETSRYLPNQKGLGEVEPEEKEEAERK